MLREGSGNAAAFAQLLEQISEVSEAAKHVVVCHGCFAQLSSFLEKIRLLFRELQEGPRVGLSPLHIIIQPLETELKNAKDLINICTVKSRFYLLLNCRTYAKCIQAILQSVATALIQLSSDSVEITLKSKNKIKLLCKDLQTTQIRVSAAEEHLVDEIELGTRNQQVGAKHLTELLLKMAVVVGVSSDPSSLRHEYAELRREKETVALDKQETEVLQLEQIISLLSHADALGSVTEREKHYQEQRRWLDSNSLPALQTFYCPITQDVMENPVEIDSGHTFEMSAIQKWFTEGHNVCPVTKMELQSLSLRPNRLLQQSIEEWKDHNTVIKLAAMAARLRSGNEEGIIEALLEIQDLCEEKSVHKYWVAAEGLIPVLVDLLGSNKRELRKKTLATLSTLVADNSENRGKVCDAGAIEYAVRSLARDAGEARQAVALLLDLSKEETLCERISKVQGCILLLVTMANSDDAHAAGNAKELLKLFAKSDDNVVLMAEVNYFKPLVQCLDKESHITQVLMANTLSRMQLSDQSRALLVQGGVLAPLVKMASVGNLECKAAALGAFRNLSVLPENRDPIIEAGVMLPLLEILFTVKSIASTVREHAAATFANLAMASPSFGIRDLWGNGRDTDEAVLHLISLLNLTGPNIQSHILRALSSICFHSASVGLRETLREGGSIQLLAHFMDDKDTEVRLYALKLLFTLTKDGGGDILAEVMGANSYRVMVDLFSSQLLEEEKAAAMGILGNLPLHNRQVTERMLQAGVLSSIVTILERDFSKMRGIRNTSLVENAAWTLIRFTLPTDIKLQEFTAKQGVIPLLVNLLSFGTPLAKCNAAMSLQQFSESTPKLSVPIKGHGGWRCFAPPPEPSCIVHKGLCSVKDTFCLLESGAISPLIQALEEREEETDEAALGALVTLVSDECWEKGSDVIVNADGVTPIIRKLTSGNAGIQEKALLILEKILRKERYKGKFGSVVQMPLVSLAQQGTALTRPLAAKILAHLNILQEQSSYF